jgi:hypothetical protein
MSVLVFRGIGHPWTSAPGWDQLLLWTHEDADGLAKLIARAKEKFWKEWFVSDSTFTAHMFKPSDATRDWEDISWQGTPRGHGHQFQIGDHVYTDYSRKITKHQVTAIEFKNACQTGVMLRVTPPVHGTAFLADDPGRGPGKVHNNAWLDAAWFRKLKKDIVR